MLAESGYLSFYRIEILRVDPEASRFARCSIDFNGIMFEVQSAYHSRASLKVIIT